MTRGLSLVTCVGALCLLSISGCGGGGGPELGTVSGKVTLNGAPLANATVQFKPDAGRPSSALTNGAGEYTLRYTADRDGALVGSHKVRITSELEAMGGEGDEPEIAGSPETVPQNYNDETTLNADVKAGDNTIDFDLTGERGPERKRQPSHEA